MSSYTVFKGAQNDYPKESTLSLPDALTGDNVLLKVTASGLCGTDLHYVSD
jgi:threonine dehydrogenase-like Zn-dependent dehydrogenase